MTTLVSTVMDDPNYKLCLDHGFIGLVNHMGDDSAITRAARVSYGNGTRKTSEDRGLIRYLMRHSHTTPFEMVEFQFHAKMPIFIARQWVRHRTANINEYSGRYSLMSNEYYIPEADDCAPQAADNKQGRSGNLTNLEIDGVQWLIDAAASHSCDMYETLLGSYNNNQENAPYSVYDDDGWFDEAYPGLARELSRMVLPLNLYTEWYWKCDLHNIFHFLKLRLDPHAQKEIRVYAEAMYELIKPYVPLACEAFEDFVLKGGTYSRMEAEIFKVALKHGLKIIQNLDNFCENNGMSPREIKEFKQKWNL